MWAPLLLVLEALGLASFALPYSNHDQAFRERQRRERQALLVGSTLEQVRCRRWKGKVLRVVFYTSRGAFEVTPHGIERPPLLAFGWHPLAAELRGKRITRAVFDGESWGCQLEGGFYLLRTWNLQQRGPEPISAQEVLVYEPGAINKDLLQWFQRQGS